MGFHFKFWGIEYLKMSDIDCSFLPSIVNCHIEFGGQTGAINTNNYLCLLPTNKINAFFLAVLWFYFVAMIPISVLGFLYRLVYATCPNIAR